MKKNARKQIKLINGWDKIRAAPAKLVMTSTGKIWVNKAGVDRVIVHYYNVNKGGGAKVLARVGFMLS